MECGHIKKLSNYFVKSFFNIDSLFNKCYIMNVC